MASRWAVVTGAGTGIGAALARELLRAGVNVVAVGRRASKLDELRESMEAMASEGSSSTGT